MLTYLLRTGRVTEKTLKYNEHVYVMKVIEALFSKGSDYELCIVIEPLQDWTESALLIICNLG